jgi:thiol:disulfide interchange protein DsbD
MIRIVSAALCLVAALASGATYAQSNPIKDLLSGGGSNEQQFLKPDQAFVFAAEPRADGSFDLRWEIADEYYLYRDKVKVTTSAAGVQLGTPVMPLGKSKYDEYFGDQVVYYGELLANVPVTNAAGVAEIPIEVTYQGCADAGLCYPPIRKSVVLRLALTEGASGAAGAASTATLATSPPDSAAPASAPAARVSEQDSLADRIRSGNLLAVIATFFGAGLLLAFTPCVLPMVPILSGIIVGAGRGTPVSRGRAFSLSVAYVLGMALTYTIAGAVFAKAGQQAQAFFQKPWIIVLFAALFVLLALAMFGFYALQVPAALQSRIAGISDKQKQGTLLGTAVMGALSSLIVTACVAPPLIAALTVIGQSGDVLRGALALFALSLGMGAPLLVVGASAGQLLPKAGPWMDAVKNVFGVMLLGVAIWMLGRILPGPVTLTLWAVLAFLSGWWLFNVGSHGGDTASSGSAVGTRTRQPGTVRQGLGALTMVYGVLLLVGALAGREDPLRPFAGLGAGGGAAAESHLAFQRIKSVEDLERAIAAATAAGRPVMLDFYADWCVSCIEMERYTFTDAGVQSRLANAVLLQADVTANDAVDQALLQRFGILGPPSILFFGTDGRERANYRVVGFKPADEFSNHVAEAFASS